MKIILWYTLSLRTFFCEFLKINSYKDAEICKFKIFHFTT